MRVPKILDVSVVGNKQLHVTFANGEEKIYDCSRILALEQFTLLRTEAFFRAVKVDAGGYGISWSDEMDLSGDELWTNGVEAKSIELSDNEHV